ncbi:hypothetical protein Tco_0730676 [Tanacetum coccineum]|uniref:Uncharacterized protein n=1 Tax=Tanacetum coccineum TaxID=301880 RepID=A0ABQ4YTF4_9ASTR
MYYPIFIKAIIHHFITKDKSISMRNRMFMHTAQDDSILGPMRFVSKSDDFQVYRSLLPNRMTNQQMWDSTAYNTYLAYATCAASPKMKRKFKKPASPSKKRTLVTVEEEEPELAKKVVPSKKFSRIQSTGVQIRDTLGVSVLKKKTPTKAERSKGIDLLSEAALLEEAQVKKIIRRSRRETSIHQAGGLGDETSFTLGVPDELKGNGDEASVQSDDEDVLENGDDLEQADDEWTESDNPRTSDDEEKTQDDEYVHTPKDYVPTNDETNDESNDVDEEEYDRIDKEFYGDVNVSLTDAEPTDEEKDNQVKDDAQATQKTELPLRSSYISSDYAAKYLNFDNIPPVDTKVVSMMDINSQLLQQWSQLLRQQLFHLFFLYSFLTSQQSTPILTPTTTEATTLTIAVPKSETLYALYQRISDLEKDVKELNTVDQSLALLLTIKYEVPNAVKEYLGTSLDDALYKVLKKHDVDIIKEHSVPAKIVNRLRQQYVPQKSIEYIRKIKMEHHALMESILEDEDAMDEGVADKLKKRKPDDADKDKGPSTGSNRGLKRQRTSKGTETSKKTSATKDSSKGKTPATSSKSSKSDKSAKDQVVKPISIQDSDNVEYDDAELNYADMPMDQGVDLEWNKGKFVDDGPEQSWLNDMAKDTKPPLTFDELMHTLIDFSAFVMNRLKIDNLTKEILVGPSYNLLKGTCKSYMELDYTMEECYRALSE